MPAPFSEPFTIFAPAWFVERHGGVFDAGRRQIERELGAPFRFATHDGTDGESPAGSCMRVQVGGDEPVLAWDAGRRVLTCKAPDQSGLFETFSLWRDLHRLQEGADAHWPVRDANSVEACIDRIRSAVADTWPSFGTHGVDWAATCAEHEPRVRSADDPIAAMQEWLAVLGDAHTCIRRSTPTGRLPLRARVVDGALRLDEVPQGTVAHAAGARPGDIIDAIDGRPVDIAGLWRRTGATAHSKDRVVALRALQAPAGHRMHLALGSGIGFDDECRVDPWPDPIGSGRNADGTGWLRIRSFNPSHEPQLDTAMDALSDVPLLVVDLRGNGGGNFLMACRFRARFLRRPGTVGYVSTTLPGGGTGPREPIDDAPAAANRRFAGQVRVRVDAETYSAAEDCLMALAGEPHVEITGGPTGGGSGRVRTLRLLPGYRLTITTCHTFTRDGHLIEGNGIDG